MYDLCGFRCKDVDREQFRIETIIKMAECHKAWELAHEKNE
jgi:hypothetical protein